MAWMEWMWWYAYKKNKIHIAVVGRVDESIAEKERKTQPYTCVLHGIELINQQESLPYANEKESNSAKQLTQDCCVAIDKTKHNLNFI